MTDNEFRESWNFSKMVAINIGSVTLSKEDVLAIDDFINRQKAEIEELEAEIEKQYEQAKADILGNMANGGTSCHWCIDQHRADAVKEFAERLKQCMASYADDWRWIEMAQFSFEEMVDLLAKEFTEGKQND